MNLPEISLHQINIQLREPYLCHCVENKERNNSDVTLHLNIY